MHAIARALGWIVGLGIIGSGTLEGPAFGTAAEAEAELSIHWQKKSYTSAGLPQDITPATLAVIEVYSEWALATGYELCLDREQRVVLFSRAKQSVQKRYARRIEGTLEAFDELFALQETQETREKRDTPDTPDTQAAESRQPIVLFELADLGDYLSLLELLKQDHPYLDAWSERAKDLAGFVLEEPLAGAWLDELEGREEWNPENELIHRVAELALLERFGRLPYWLAQGTAWQLEQRLTKGIYVFPQRSSFVSVTEHTGWDKELKRSFKKRHGEPLEMAECDLKRLRFEPEKARVAWGLVGYLARYRPESLTLACLELARYRKANERVTAEDGSWRKRTGFEIPLAVQAEILRRAAGADLFEEAGEAFRKGRGYRPPRP